MAGFYEVEKAILEQFDEHGELHVTYIKRQLDQEFDTRITRPVVEAFLDQLSDAGYTAPTSNAGRYKRAQELTA